MSIFRLWFSGGVHPELVKTNLTHPLLATQQISNRGRSSGAYFKGGTFQWRPAVHALSILLLRTKLHVVNVGEPILEGWVGSPAYSLEYAIRKCPDWILEMFGRAENSGEPLVRRLIRRSNSGARRNGPVALSFGFGASAEIQYEIYIDDVLIQERDQLTALLARLEDSWPIRSPDAVPLKLAHNNLDAKSKQASTNVDPFVSFFQQPLREEILFSLRSLNIFTRDGAKKILSEIHDSLAAVGTVGIGRGFGEEIDEGLVESDRFIAQSDEIVPTRIELEVKKMRIWHVPVANAHNALFYQVLNRGRFPLTIDINYLHTGDMLTKICKGAEKELPEIISLGAYGAGVVLKDFSDRGYVPFMIAPKVGVRIVTPRKDSKSAMQNGKLSGVSMLMLNLPSSSSLYRDTLTKRGVLTSNSVSETFFTPEQLQSVLDARVKDARIFLPFPNHILCTRLFDYEYCDNQWISDSYQNGLILVRRSVLANKNLAALLKYEIVQSWIELQSGGATLDNIIRYFLTDPAYSNGMKRYVGWGTEADRNAATKLAINQ